MGEKIIDGRAIGKEIREEIKARVEKLKERGYTPGLAVILVGENQASHTYVRNKQKSSNEVGMKSELVNFQQL